MSGIQLGKLTRILNTLSKIGVKDQSLIFPKFDNAKFEQTIAIGFASQPDLETHEYLTANGFVLDDGDYIYRPR